MEHYTFPVENTQERHLFSLSVLGVESHPYSFLLAKRSMSQVTARRAGPVEAPKGWALELDGLQCKSGLDIFPDEWLWAKGFSFLCLCFLICRSGANQMRFPISPATLIPSICSLGWNQCVLRGKTDLVSPLLLKTDSSMAWLCP